MILSDVFFLVTRSHFDLFNDVARDAGLLYDVNGRNFFLFVEVESALGRSCHEQPLGKKNAEKERKKIF